MFGVSERSKTLHFILKRKIHQNRADLLACGLVQQQVKFLHSIIKFLCNIVTFLCHTKEGLVPKPFLSL